MSKKWQLQPEIIHKKLSECVEKRRKLLTDLLELEKELAYTLSLIENKEAGVETDMKQEYICKAFIKSEEVKQAIEVALETGCKVHEEVTRREILEFVKKKFGLTGKAVEEKLSKRPKLQLLCKLIIATSLKVKSGNGNLYCRVGILNQKHYHPDSDFKLMAEWHKVGEVGDMVSTSYKTATLEPSWNEDIQLSVNNIKEDVIVVEVWNKKTLSFKGLMSNSKEDFIGWMFYPLHRVPIIGTELKFTLMSRGKKLLNSFITLFLSIQGDTEGKAVQTYLDEHHLLTRALIDDFSKGDNGERELEWKGDLCAESEKLLEYHGALNGLNKLQMASVRLSELFKYHKHETVDMKAFIELIKKMKQLQLLFPGQETDSKTHDHAHLGSSLLSSSLDSPELLNKSWVDRLFSDLQLLEDDLMDIMNDHIRLVNFEFGGKPESIYPHLSLLLELYTFKAFTDQMSPGRELGRQLEKCIEPSVNSWFSMLKATVMPNHGLKPKELRDLCAYCLTWSEKVVKKLILHETFARAHVEYFSFYIWSLDKQLSEEVKKGLNEYSKKNPDTITFEIYTYFQRMVEISENADEDIHSKLNILGFHKWFQEYVPGWIDIATEKLENRIKQAIELDEITKVTTDLPFSTSAIDACGFLLQIATFWKHLDWPVASEAYGYAVSLIQNMCNCVNIFIDKIFSSLSPADLHDEQGRFKASEKLCLVLNDIFYVREQIGEMPQHMELEKLYKMLHEEDEKKYALAEEGGLDVGDMNFNPIMTLNIKAKNFLSELLIIADKDFMDKINELVREICQNILPDIKQFIIEIVNTNADDNYVEVDPLFGYLTENLVTLGINLLPPVFQSVTTTLWEVSVEAIAEVVDDSHKKNLPVYLPLYDTLMSLREFYYCNGDGVSSKTLDSEAYFSLKSKLDILGMPTDELIVRFYSDFMKHQQEKIKEEKFGELVLSVGFIKELSAIVVNVIQGDDMEMITEPYIKLRLSSVCQASDKHWKTKPVKGMQKAPFFYENIKLSVTEEEMNSEGSLVLFYLLDRKLKSRGPRGMCALACNKIPQLSATSFMTASEGLKLPLFQCTLEGPILTELILRRNFGDGMAVNFWEKSQLLLNWVIPNLKSLAKKAKFKKVSDVMEKGKMDSTMHTSKSNDSHQLQMSENQCNKYDHHGVKSKDVFGHSMKPELHQLDLLEGNGNTVRVIDEVAAKWEKLAMRLYFKSHDMDRIRRDHHQDSTAACQTMFSEWLNGKGRGPISWNTLIQALREAKMTLLASNLELIIDVIP